MNITTVFYVLFSIIALASCTSGYEVLGTSNISTLDGRKLYLKVLSGDDFKSIDSCDVLHGEFSFSGSLDTIKMATIFMEDESVMPIVLEGGKIQVKLDNTQQTVSGTPLNDKLTKFITQYNQIKGAERELVHKHDQAIMNGGDMDIVIEDLNKEADRLSKEEDKLVTTFVCDNFDNILGPGVFFMMTVGYQYPELTPWIEDIMSKATDKFKNDSYVKDYYSKAQENQQIMNGLRDVTMPRPTSPNKVPTPNELARPDK